MIATVYPASAGLSSTARFGPAPRRRSSVTRSSVRRCATAGAV
jgi:hypothetical protein